MYPSLDSIKPEPLLGALLSGLFCLSSKNFLNKILSKLSAKEIAEEIEELDTDDAADIVGELPENLQEKVLSKIEDAEHSQDIRELLNYEEGTAGAIMAKELVSVNENLSVRAAEDLAKQRKSGIKKVKLKDPDTIDLENNLTAKLGLNVSIDHKGKKGGSIKIEYKSLDQLEMVTSKLKI